MFNAKGMPNQFIERGISDNFLPTSECVVRGVRAVIHFIHVRVCIQAKAIAFKTDTILLLEEITAYIMKIWTILLTTFYTYGENRMLL